jgi:hypothetical protein
MKKHKLLHSIHLPLQTNNGFIRGILSNSIGTYFLTGMVTIYQFKNIYKKNKANIDRHKDKR